MAFGAFPPGLRPDQFAMRPAMTRLKPVSHCLPLWTDRATVLRIVKHHLTSRLVSSWTVVLTQTFVAGTLPLALAEPTDFEAPDSTPSRVVRFMGEYVAPSTLGDGDTKAAFYQMGLQTHLPFPITKDLSGNVGLAIGNRGYQFRSFGDFMPGLESPLDQALIARVAPGVTYRLNQQWRIFATGSWLYSGEVGSSASEAGLWGGSAGVFYDLNSSLTLAGGLSVTERFDRSALYVPLLGLNWRIDEQWTLLAGDVANAVNGPVVGLQASYRLDERWTFFGLGGYTSSFTRFSDSSSIQDGSLNYESGVVLVGVEYAFTPGLVLRLSAGARVAQEYTFRDTNGNDLADDESGASATAGLAVRASF